MSQITEQQVLDSLRHIIDPDLHKDIVSLGFIKNVQIQGGQVSFVIELTTPACPVKAEFQRQAEKAVRRIEGVTDVRVTMSSAPRRSPMEDLHANSPLQKVKTLIAVSSCKGGVGKSTLAAHIALELANRGFQVGLLDTDIFGPSVPTLFGIPVNEPLYTNPQKQLIPPSRLGLKLMSFGFLLKDGPAVLRGPIVSQYIMQLLHATDWGDLDYLFLDMPPGTGDIQLSITQSVRLDGALIVTTRQSLSLVDVTRGILMFEKVKVPILGIIENMSYVKCGSCSDRNDIFGESHVGSLKDRFGLDVLAEIPIEKQYNRMITAYRALPHFVEATNQVIRAVGRQSRMETTVPEITKDSHQVTLKWADGTTVSVDHRSLRASCACANCVDEITGEKRLDEGAISPDIAPEDITPLGHYAVSVRWSDGHTSSIYAYEMLKERFGAATCDEAISDVQSASA